MSGHNEDDRMLREAQVTIAADRVRQSMDDGTMTFSDYPPERVDQVLAALPPVELETTTVPTSVRLPLPLHQRLRAYADEHDTSASTLIRQWIELHLAADDDRPISLADAVRALSTLRSQNRPEAA